MNTQDMHRGLLERLLALRGQQVDRVRLVARLNNPQLTGLSSPGRMYVFLPDMHLMSREADARFQYGFRRVSARRWLRREELLEALCVELLDFWATLPRGRSLKPVQLGDFVDLWRLREAPTDSAESLVNRILDDNPVAEQRLVARGSDSLEADILVGNHDHEMNLSTRLRGARSSFSYGVGGRHSVLATHGDLFDDIELYSPDELARWFVQNFGPRVSANAYEVDGTVHRREGSLTGSQGSEPVVLSDADDNAILPDWVNVWVTDQRSTPRDRINSHDLLSNALGMARKLRAGRRQALRAMGRASALPDLRTIVIGHSHHARICVHRDARNPTNDLVLADCGAWIESATFRDKTVPSCQLGVLCGGDLRLYQLDPHASLYE